MEVGGMSAGGKDSWFGVIALAGAALLGYILLRGDQSESSPLASVSRYAATAEQIKEVTDTQEEVDFLKNYLSNPPDNSYLSLASNLPVSQVMSLEDRVDYFSGLPEWINAAGSVQKSVVFSGVGDVAQVTVQTGSAWPEEYPWRKGLVYNKITGTIRDELAADPYAVIWSRDA